MTRSPIEAIRRARWRRHRRRHPLPVVQVRYLRALDPHALAAELTTVLEAIERDEMTSVAQVREYLMASRSALIDHWLTEAR